MVFGWDVETTTACTLAPTARASQARQGVDKQAGRAITLDRE